MMARPEQHAQWIINNQDKKGSPEFNARAEAYKASRYAQWIINNQDKKGTPEFNTRAEAYKASRAQATKQTIEPVTVEFPEERQELAQPKQSTQSQVAPQALSTFAQDDLPQFQKTLPSQQPTPTPQKTSALDVAAEAASAINRGVTNLADLLTVDQVNAVLELAGSDKRLPTITNLLSSATQGGQMQPGLFRDVVRTGGEMVGPGAATGAMTRGLVKSLPAVMPGESALVGTARSLGAGTTMGGDVVASAASGAGAELGEEVGGTPGAVTGAVLAPTAVFGAKSGLQALTKRFGRTVPIVDSAGLPTKELKSALDRRKLDITDIADDLDQLPLTIKPKNANQLVDDLVKVKLMKGESTPALATVRLDKPFPIPRSMRGEMTPGAFLKDKKIIPDELGKKAVSVGFNPGDVAGAKGGNDPTRREMRKMLGIHRQIYRNAAKASDYNRPSNVPGRITQNKIDLVMSKADNLRKELDGIAKNQLKGKRVDFDNLENKVLKELEKMRIKIPDDMAKDVTSLKAYLSKKEAFAGSNIKESANSQNLIRKTLSILEDAKDGNAESTHFVKRQIDAFLDDVWGETPGLKNSGINFAKSVRKLSNEAVRDVDNRYKTVNEELSKALKLKESVQKYLTKKADLKDADLSEKKIGNELRKLLTNYAVGPDINDTLKQIDDVAGYFGAKKELGDLMDVDVQRLVQFSNTLDNRFGPVASPRNFKGETAAGTKLGNIAAAAETASEVMTSPVLGTARGAKKVYKSMTQKKQNDLEAYDVMQKLLKRGK